MSNSNIYLQKAQICENGHIRNAYTKTSPEYNENYCSLCGSKVISECPGCGSIIRGAWTEEYPVPKVLDYSPLEGITRGYEIKTYVSDNPISLPAFCYECGTAFPWTEEFLNTAEEIVSNINDLTVEQKKILKETFPDLIVETPKSKLAALRCSNILNSLVNSLGKEALISLLKDHVVEGLLMLMNL